MRRADKRTEYRLIKAYSNSDWDNCEFAIIHTPDDWCLQLQERFATVQQLRKDPFFIALTYEDWAISGFYACPDEWDVNKILNGKEWVFIDIKPEELESLPQPENAFSRYELVLDNSTFGSFRAFGKHSGERFYTETFFVNEWMVVPKLQQI